MTISRAAGIKVVSGKEEGPILPDTVQELATLSVELEPGVELKRGVFANELVTRGVPFKVAGPICCTTSARFELAGSGDGTVIGGIACGKSLSVHPAGGDSLLRVVGDVTASRVAIRRGVVYGNVLAETAYLEDTIVLGQVACLQRLELKRCVVNAFHSGEARIVDDSLLLTFAATARKTVEFEGSLWSLALVPLNELKGGGLDRHRDKIIALTAEDIHETSGTDGGLTIDPFDRVMDLEESAAADNCRMIARLTASRFEDRVRLPDHAQSDVVNGELLESSLWAILQNPQEMGSQ